MPVRHVSYFWKVLERSFPPEVKDSVKGLRMSKDEKGVVFDLPSDLASVVKVTLKMHRRLTVIIILLSSFCCRRRYRLQENWRDGYVKLTTPTSLPELKERSQDFYDKQRSNDGMCV